MSNNIFRMIRNFVRNSNNFFIGKAVVTKLLVSGILSSKSLIFVFKTVAVTKSLVSGIFLSTSPIFFSRFYLSVMYWFMWNNVVASGIFSKLFTFVISELDFVFLTILTFIGTVLVYQNLNHLLLFLNYSN